MTRRGHRSAGSRFRPSRPLPGLHASNRRHRAPPSWRRAWRGRHERRAATISSTAGCARRLRARPDDSRSRPGRLNGVCRSISNASTGAGCFPLPPAGRTRAAVRAPGDGRTNAGSGRRSARARARAPRCARHRARQRDVRRLDAGRRTAATRSSRHRESRTATPRNARRAARASCGSMATSSRPTSGKGQQWRPGSASASGRAGF